jgi:hypothetical protein
MVQKIEDESVDLRLNMSMLDQEEDQKAVLNAINQKLSGMELLWKKDLEKGLIIQIPGEKGSTKSYRVREHRGTPFLLTRVFRAIFYRSKTDKKIIELDVTRSASQARRFSDADGFYRIDKKTWSIFRDIEGERREVRFNLPEGKEKKDSIALLKTIEQIFTTSYSTELSQKRLQTGFGFKIQRKHCPETTYRIQQQREPSYLTKLFRKIVNRINPYPYSEIPNKKIITLDVTRPGIWKRILAKIFCIKNSVYTFKKKELQSPTLRFTGSASYLPSFADPFTVLSTQCFQTIEPETTFVMHKEHRGAYRLVLSQLEQLRLEKIKKRTPKQIDENRRTIQAYKSFLEKEYGKEIVVQILTLCGVDLDSMIANGRPLLPDHVFKCNIAACNIEIPHVEAFWKKLQSAHRILQEEKSDLTQWSEKQQKQPSSLKKLSDLFSIREFRGLEMAVRKRYKDYSLALLCRFLEEIVGGRRVESIRDLSETISSQIISMVMPKDDELDRAFTGRKLRHLEIRGSHAMENHDNENPCRLIFELLHTYKDLAKTDDWANFYELLAHTVVKKALYRPPHGHDQERMRVGLILPAPSTKNGTKRWYYNEAFLDDSQGRVSYDLIPVAKNAKDSNGSLLPFIRVFRSTSSSDHSMNSMDSIAADLAHRHSPGSLKPELGYKHQGDALKERTIPLWVAHFMAPRSLAPDLADKELKEAARLFIEYVKQNSPDNRTLKSVLKIKPGKKLSLSATV